MKVSEKGERNETESRQPQKDTEASGDQNENADPRDGQTNSKSSLKKEKGKAKMNSEKSPTFANTDLGGEEEHQIDKYYLGRGSSSVMSEQKKKRRKKDSNQLRVLAVSNMAKKVRKKPKKNSEDKTLSTVSRENKATIKSDREWDPLYQFADIILKAHEREMKKLNDGSGGSIQIIETAFADPKIIATGDIDAPKLTLKTRDIDDVYDAAEVCSSSQPQNEDEAEFDSIAQEWAKELKNISDFRQRAIARKAIIEILSEAQQGTLHEESIQINTSAPHEETDEEWTQTHSEEDTHS